MLVSAKKRGQLIGQLLVEVVLVPLTGVVDNFQFVLDTERDKRRAGVGVDYTATPPLCLVTSSVGLSRVVQGRQGQGVNCHEVSRVKGSRRHPPRRRAQDAPEFELRVERLTDHLVYEVTGVMTRDVLELVVVGPTWDPVKVSVVGQLVVLRGQLPEDSTELWVL